MKDLSGPFLFLGREGVLMTTGHRGFVLILYTVFNHEIITKVFVVILILLLLILVVV